MTLAVRARAGDRLALALLFGRYESRLRRIVAIRLGPQLHTGVDPVALVGRTQVLAARKIGGLLLRSPAALILWFAHLALCQVSQDLATGGRAEGPAPERDARRRALPPATAGRPPAPRPGPRTHRSPRLEHHRPACASAQVEQAVDAVVSALPPELREVILLRDYHGGTWEFVALELGRSSLEETRLMHLRARRCLARRLGAGRPPEAHRAPR